MKTPRIVNAVGHIDDELVGEAAREAVVIKKNPWIKWGAMAACLCLAVVAAFVVPNIIPSFGPEDVEGPYSFTVAYVGWSDSQTIYDGAINRELLQSEPNEHLPIFKMDTLDDLEQFKAKYETVFAMDQGFDNVRSFEATLSQAQWDREIFYEEHSMLIIYIPANSGSLRFYVEEIKTKDNSLCFSVGQKNSPESGTDNMAGWFLFVGVEKEEIQKYTSFDAVIE